MRILPLLAVALLVFAVPAGAAEKAKDSKDPKEADGGQYVSLSPVAVPIVLKGQLINYIFVTLRLELSPSVDASKMRDREPFFRDAFVRAAHRTPFVKSGDYTHVDEGALKAAMMAQSARIAGPGAVASVTIVSAQAQKLTGLPHAEGPTQPRAPIP